MNHAWLVEAMKAPSFYPPPVKAVRFLQTHVSSVFLTGALAYKLKKPVDFGFLDFTTPELRRRFCEKEVELNRRLAPSVYLRVEPVTVVEGRPVLAGGGEAVDWVVVMRELAQELHGPEVLARGELTRAKMDAVVDRLVPFYREAATGPGVDEYGTLEGFKVNTDENFEQTAPYVDVVFPLSHYQAIRSYTEAFYAANRALFQRRVAGGWIRECHGDLHLGNIFFEESPIIFDCIEFNERFRCCDVATDLGFLVMDLEYSGRPDLARGVVERYVAQSGDRELPALIGFFACYRAYVRGKIACFTSDDPGLDEEARIAQRKKAAEYFALSHQYAQEGKVAS